MRKLPAAVAITPIPRLFTIHVFIIRAILQPWRLYLQDLDSDVQKEVSQDLSVAFYKDQAILIDLVPRAERHALTHLSSIHM